jgi:RNA polymerase sigma-70 factor (sigma-E family)
VQDDVTALYHASYRRLVAQVFAFTTDLAEAQDAVQEAFARALARHRTLSDIDAPEAWLRTVAINIVRRRWRRKQLLNTILLRERPLVKFVAEAPEPDRTDLREALASLPKAYREVIVLHYLADLPVDEVASILEVPVGTVKSRLSRGRDALKGLLDDVEAPPLAEVKQRAGKIRTRRRVTQASAALAVLCAAVIAFFPGMQKPQVPADQPTPAPVYAAEGISITGINDVATVPNLDGDILRMDFHNGVGWLWTSANTYARSTDNGQHWEQVAAPESRVFDPPWRPSTLGWQTSGYSFWAAPRPTQNGIWWIAGQTEAGQWQLAHTTDPTKQNSWQTIDLPAPPKDREFASVVSGERVIVFSDAVYTVDLTDNRKRIADLSSVVLQGDPVMLADGRMICADDKGHWQMSRDLGVTWTQLEGSLPAVAELHATGNGYVAIGLFLQYAATSTDGVTWQKLPIH